jgi:aryl-alcohol dehydrogenase-like predicted oxidoreductase
VQLPLSLGLPDAEDRLLPLAESKSIAVLVNRPFQEGALLREVRKRPMRHGLRSSTPEVGANCSCATSSRIRQSRA